MINDAGTAPAPAAGVLKKRSPGSSWSGMSLRGVAAVHGGSAVAGGGLWWTDPAAALVVAGLAARSGRGGVARRAGGRGLRRKQVR